MRSLGLTCSTCWWFQAVESGRGVCRARPPVAGVVGFIEAGLGGSEGSMRAETVWPVVGQNEPGCAQHPDAPAAIAAQRQAR